MDHHDREANNIPVSASPWPYMDRKDKDLEAAREQYRIHLQRALDVQEGLRPKGIVFRPVIKDNRVVRVDVEGRKSGYTR